MSNHDNIALQLADRLDAVPETGADPELVEQAAAELRDLVAEVQRLNMYAAGADQLVEVWKGRAQEFMSSRDRLLNDNRHLFAKLDRLRAELELSQPSLCGQWICEYPGDVFVVFDPMTDGARIVGAARTLREAGEILEAVGQAAAAHRQVNPAGEADMKVYHAIADNYTRQQPARQPLTDEQIEAMWQQSCREHFGGLQREIHLARAVEAAHGIGGKA